MKVTLRSLRPLLVLFTVLGFIGQRFGHAENCVHEAGSIPVAIKVQHELEDSVRQANQGSFILVSASASDNEVNTQRVLRAMKLGSYEKPQEQVIFGARNTRLSILKGFKDLEANTSQYSKHREKLFHARKAIDELAERTPQVKTVSVPKSPNSLDQFMNVIEEGESAAIEKYAKASEDFYVKVWSPIQKIARSDVELLFEMAVQDPKFLEALKHVIANDNLSRWEVLEKHVSSALAGKDSLQRQERAFGRQKEFLSNLVSAAESVRGRSARPTAENMKYRFLEPIFSKQPFDVADIIEGAVPEIKKQYLRVTNLDLPADVEKAQRQLTADKIVALSCEAQRTKKQMHLHVSPRDWSALESDLNQRHPGLFEFSVLPTKTGQSHSHGSLK